MEVKKKKRRHIPESSRRRMLRHRYGLTVDEYNTMYKQQDGKCAICGCTPTRLYVDHDHESNKHRQLLCPGCNTMIGGLENVKNGDGIKYLIKHNAWNALARLELLLRERENNGSLHTTDKMTTES